MEYLREDLARKYGEILPHLRTINNIEKKIAEEKSKSLSETPDLKTVDRAQTIGTILIILGIIVLVVFFFMSISENYPYLSVGRLMVDGLCGAPLLILGIIVKVSAVTGAKAIAAQRERELRIKAIEDQYKQSYENELAIVSQLIDVVPLGYRYELAVEFMYNCFLNQRADSVKEAINLYEEQLHRWKMENIAEQNMRIQEQQASYLNSIRGMTNVNTAINVADAISRLF